MKFSGVLPDKILRKLSPEDRASLGRAGMTAEEAGQRAQVKNERELQKLIVSYLRLQGIEPLWFRTDKRTTANVGWPDITFAAWSRTKDGRLGFHHAVVWEVKFGNGKLRKEQADLAARLVTAPNGWSHRVIMSLSEAQQHLKELGIVTKQ